MLSRCKFNLCAETCLTKGTKERWNFKTRWKCLIPLFSIFIFNALNGWRFSVETNKYKINEQFKLIKIALTKFCAFHTLSHFDSKRKFWIRGVWKVSKNCLMGLKWEKIRICQLQIRVNDKEGRKNINFITNSI